MSLGDNARRAREKGYRRIARIENYIQSNLSNERIRDWGKRKIKEIKSAIQGTRRYSKEGKRYKTKTDRYVKGQIERLESAVFSVPARLNANERSFAMTQHQINMASVNRPSVYTKQDVQLFYRATQKIWQVQGVGEHNRNEAILDYFNSIRLENGLTPLKLDEIVDYVLKANEDIQKGLNTDTEEDMTQEQREWHEKAQQGDNEDNEKGSPPGIGARIIADIRDALANLFVLPNPTDL